jgi:hypothetical protein
MTKSELAQVISKIQMMALDGLLASPCTPDGVKMGDYFCKIFDLAAAASKQYIDQEILATTPYEKI